MRFKIILSFCLLVCFFSAATIARAEDECANKSVQEKVVCYQEKLQKNQGEQKTLASTIAYLSNKVALTESQISQTEEEIKKLEEEIATLSVKIDRLDTNLDETAKLLVVRVGADYRRHYIQPFFVFLSSGGFADFLERNKYLQAAQQNDRKILLELQNSKTQHEEQKKIEEEKQKQAEALKKKLADQNATLLQQKRAKTDLLAQTKNSEQVYQQLLNNARQEYQAILGILAGKGAETEAGHVNEGQQIASIIQGASCNSSGAHLHFMVSEGGGAKNPFSYLNGIDSLNCSGPGECSAADPFNPSGGWNWPINPRVRFNQGYGSTWAIQNTWVGKVYQFHNGIDINSESNSTVKAVKSGTLYKGTYLLGCVLPYVRVHHDNDNLDTFYLHVYY